MLPQALPARQTLTDNGRSSKEERALGGRGVSQNAASDERENKCTHANSNSRSRLKTRSAACHMPWSAHEFWATVRQGTRYDVSTEAAKGRTSKRALRQKFGPAGAKKTRDDSVQSKSHMLYPTAVKHMFERSAGFSHGRDESIHHFGCKDTVTS